MKRYEKMRCVSLNGLLLLLVCLLAQQTQASNTKNHERAKVLSAYKNISRAYADRNVRRLLSFYTPGFSLGSPTEKNIIDYEGFEYALTFWMEHKDMFKVTYHVQKIVCKGRRATVLLKEYQKHTVPKKEGGTVTFLSELMQDNWRKSYGVWRINSSVILKTYNAYETQH